MDEQCVTVEQTDRLDKLVLSIVLERVPNIGRRFIAENISSFVRVEGRINVKAGTKLQTGVKVCIDFLTLQKLLKKDIYEKKMQNRIISQKGPLNIIYEDSDFLVINKPSGLIVHPGTAVYKNTLANYIKQYFESLDIDVTQLPRVGIVHRLDKGTSGLMVITKNIDAYHYLSLAFERHNIYKVYKARVVSLPQKFQRAGLVTSKMLLNEIEHNVWCNEVDNWYEIFGVIKRDFSNRKRMKLYTSEGYITGLTNGKYARTLLRYYDENTVFAKICTGRTHQIRATLKALGLVISGDSLYSSSRGINPSKISLEACFLAFYNPQGKLMYFSTI
jgi:23S rRNA pseudouridine1911/1915/1917 synthase